MFLDSFNFEFQAASLLKIPAALAAFIYIVFAFVVVKQVYKMTETLEVGLEGLLKAVSFLHLFFSIGALLAILIIL